MKRLGIIGGTGPESTVEYYRRLIAAHRARHPVGRQRRVRLPLLSIVEATAEAAVAAELQRLALFGTRFTMEAALFPEAFTRRGLSIVVPNPEEQAFIHAKVYGRAFRGDDPGGDAGAVGGDRGGDEAARGH